MVVDGDVRRAGLGRVEAPPNGQWAQYYERTHAEALGGKVPSMSCGKVGQSLAIAAVAAAATIAAPPTPRVHTGWRCTDKGKRPWGLARRKAPLSICEVFPLPLFFSLYLSRVAAATSWRQRTAQRA